MRNVIQMALRGLFFLAKITKIAQRQIAMVSAWHQIVLAITLGIKMYLQKLLLRTFY